MNDLLYNQMFENKIYKCFGYEFQNYFFEIMKHTYNDDFIMPRPQGRYGDRKNDGYIPSKNEYYAVYGPENIDLDVKYTIGKLETDLEGLIKNIEAGEWSNPIKKFVYVVNTRNLKMFPVEIVQKAELLSKKYSIEVCLCGSYEIRMLFEKLPLENKKMILQTYVILDDISLNIEVLNSLIDKINNSNYKKSQIDGYMDFEKKIKFNNLSEDRGADLLCASFNVNALDSALNELDITGLIQEQLANLLKDIYNDGKNKYNNENEIFDFLIFKLMEESSDNISKVNFKIVKETVLIIMSKYFENCTIFEKARV